METPPLYTDKGEKISIQPAKNPLGQSAWCAIGTHSVRRNNTDAILIGCISVLVCKECQAERGL